MTIRTLHNTETLTYAKEELIKYITKIDPSYTVDGDGICLGYLSDFGLSESEIEDRVLDDVIDISIIGSNGYIAGSNDRSVLMGVYDLLKSLGCRWVRPGEDGEYIPQSVEEAVDISARVYRLFKESGITVLRIGLPDSAELKENYIAGAYHPSLGELVMSRDIRNRIEESLCGKKEAQVRVNPKFISKVNGNKCCNIEYFKSKGIKIKLTEDSSVYEFTVTKIH